MTAHFFHSTSEADIGRAGLDGEHRLPHGAGGAGAGIFDAHDRKAYDSELAQGKLTNHALLTVQKAGNPATNIGGGQPPARQVSVVKGGGYGLGGQLPG